jgi:hypothetical protein
MIFATTLELIHGEAWGTDYSGVFIGGHGASLFVSFPRGAL